MNTLPVEERLERLEKENRRLRMLVLALIVLAGAGVALSAVSGVRAQAPAWRRTVEAEKFVLRDSSGKRRAVLGMAAGAPDLILYDASGKTRASLDMFGGEPGLEFYDASDTKRVWLDGSADGPSLTLRDSGGFESVIGHVALQTPTTGSQISSSAASIHLFNKAGNVIWAAP
jgi:hypothetical protein